MNNREEVIKAISLICIEYEIEAFSDERIDMWCKGLERFPDGAVRRSTANHIMTNNFKPQLANIVLGCHAMQDSLWLGAEEAWALVPKSEQETALLTKEISEALAIAQPLIDEKDKIGARMAFKDAYSRLTEKSKALGRKPEYFVSLGLDQVSRASTLADGVRSKKISIEYATSVVPELAYDIVKLSGIKNHPLIAAPSKEGADQIKKIMLMLGGKK